MGQTLERILPIAAAVAATVAFPGNAVWAAPLAAGATSGAENYSHTHNLGSALKSGAFSGAGSYIGGNLGASAFPGAGNVGDVLESGLGNDLGSTVGQALGGGAMNASLGGIAGSTLGGQLGNSLAPQGPGKRAGTYPYDPSQQSLGNAPNSLANLGGVTNKPGAGGNNINGASSLTPMQQASGLATQGLYGGGLGSQEQGYYGKLINNQLVDGSGKVSPLSSLSPIEQSYNSKLGFGNEANSNSLLEALSKWKPNAA